MSNKKEQTTVEWYTHRLYEIEIAYNQGVIDTEVYAKSKTHALEQAKEMEKAEKIKFATDFFFYWYNQTSGTNTYEAVEKFYNETYGGNK